ncbi:CCA tRNA nucleotidyltransferase 1, mitochondrial isoform X2 [Oratosquilla oratoria]
MMKVSDEQLSYILQPGVKELANHFTSRGHEIRVAGGAVRDLLMGKVPQDLDFATTATPPEMKQMFEDENVRMINAGGEKHGTVTARLQEQNFECTTLRIDVVTDGRHAEVEFTKDWKLDANRRDLTINAMFLGLDGVLYDYFNGAEHLKERKVLFVGEADTRIKEDYLRILRYFRFYGRIADDPDKHSPEVLDSIKKNVEGLSRIAGERIWVELQKIVTGKFGGELLAEMVKCGVGSHIGLGESIDCENMLKVYKQCQETNMTMLEMHPMTLLASVFQSEEEAFKFIARIKCSKKEKDLLLFVISHRDFVYSCKDFKGIQDMIVDYVIGEKRNREIFLSYVRQILLYTCSSKFLEELDSWYIPKFPVSGGMLIEKGVEKKKTKFVLKDMLDKWKESNFEASAEELLATL